MGSPIQMNYDANYVGNLKYSYNHIKTVKMKLMKFILITLLTFFFFLLLFTAAPTAYGDSQVKGRIGAVAAGLCHSHSDMGSEPPLRPRPQLTAMP